jgi:hypothetical protein
MVILEDMGTVLLCTNGLSWTSVFLMIVAAEDTWEVFKVVEGVEDLD